MISQSSTLVILSHVNRNNKQGIQRRQSNFGKTHGGKHDNQAYNQIWTTRKSNKPQCKVCGKLGHMALNFWHGFIQDFNPSSSSFRNTNQGSMFSMLATPILLLR